jgi:hypothetical protein
MELAKRLRKGMRAGGVGFALKGIADSHCEDTEDVRVVVEQFV